MALASYSPRPSKPRNSNYSSEKTRLKPSKVSKPSKEVVCHLPQPQTASLPPKIQFLLTFEKTYSVITFVIVALTLATYAWTVYSPKMWSSEYRKLKDLQRHERYLTTTNETLKNQMADQAQKPNSGLSKVNPGHNVFIMAKPPHPPFSPSLETPTLSPLINHPLGY